MKKVHIAWMAAVVLTLALSSATIAGTPKAEDGMIIGEVIDITSYAMFNRTGAENADAGKYRVEHGFPVGILEDGTGDIWIAVYRIPVPAAGLQTANATLLPHVGNKIVAQGLKYRAKGVNVVRLSLVSEY